MIRFCGRARRYRWPRVGLFHYRMKRCQYCGAQYSDEVVTCVSDGHPLDGSEESLEGARHIPAPRVHCPACGAADDYTLTVALKSSWSWLAFLAGGIPAILFRNAGRRRRARCNKCNELFYLRTPVSKFSLTLFWLLIGSTIFGLISLLIGLLVEVFSH